MAQKIEKAEANTSKDKILVQIGEQRKEWVTNVSTLADCPQAEVIRVLVDIHAQEDPENFAIKVKKFRLKLKLQDLEQREAEIQKEKEELTRSIEGAAISEGREELLPR